MGAPPGTYTAPRFVPSQRGRRRSVDQRLQDEARRNAGDGAPSSVADRWGHAEAIARLPAPMRARVKSTIASLQQRGEGGVLVLDLMLEALQSTLDEEAAHGDDSEEAVAMEQVCEQWLQKYEARPEQRV